jgi:hypothetical protein
LLNPEAGLLIVCCLDEYLDRLVQRRPEQVAVPVKEDTAGDECRSLVAVAEGMLLCYGDGTRSES